MIYESSNRRSDTGVGVWHSWVWVRQDSGVECKAWHLHLICIWLCGERGITGRRIYCWNASSLLFEQQHRVNLGKGRRGRRRERKEHSAQQRYFVSYEKQDCIKTHMLQILINQHEHTLCTTFSKHTQALHSVTPSHSRGSHIASCSLNLGSILQ